MQQTETYKLNLIETSDPFSPQALNENAQKLEQALSDAQAADDALVAQLAAFEVRRIAVGVFQAVYDRVVDVGFRPKAVITHAVSDNLSGGIFIQGRENFAALVENGFRITGGGSATNASGVTYAYVALG